MIPPLTLPSTSPNAKTEGATFLYIRIFHDTFWEVTNMVRRFYDITAFERLLMAFPYILSWWQEPRGIFSLYIFHYLKTYIKIYTFSFSFHSRLCPWGLSGVYLLLLVSFLFVLWSLFILSASRFMSISVFHLIFCFQLLSSTNFSLLNLGILILAILLFLSGSMSDHYFLPVFTIF